MNSKTLYGALLLCMCLGAAPGSAQEAIDPPVYEYESYIVIDAGFEEIEPSVIDLMIAAQCYLSQYYEPQSDEKQHRIPHPLSKTVAEFEALGIRDEFLFDPARWEWLDIQIRFPSYEGAESHFIAYRQIPIQLRFSHQAAPGFYANSPLLSWLTPPPLVSRRNEEYVRTNLLGDALREEVEDYVVTHVACFGNYLRYGHIAGGDECDGNYSNRRRDFSRVDPNCQKSAATFSSVWNRQVISHG
jgi:hypothetical protein